MTDQRPLDVLLVEDAERDAILVARALAKAGLKIRWTRVDAPAELERSLREGRWDVALIDFDLPEFDAFDALRVVRRYDEDLPCIVVSGAVGEEIAVDVMRAGASDYVMKDRLFRLAPAVEREIRDAKGRKERTAALVELAREREESLRVRDEFITVTAHELHTPLTPLLMQTEYLLNRIQSGSREALDPDRLIARIQMIDRAARRMSALVENLLDVSQITVGRVGLHLADVDLAAVAEAVARDLADMLERSGSPIVWTRPPDPVTGRWDKLRLRIALRNLLTNAAKFGSRRPIEITIGHSEDEAWISFRDHGRGLTQQEQERVFERFGRSAPVRNYGGFGLGLWIVRRVAEDHGGRVSIWSEPGEGARLTLVLPRTPASGEGSGAPRQNADTKDGEP